MQSIESKGVVQRIVEKNGEFLISFPNHDGIFRLADPALREKVLQSSQQKKEISFTYDRDLRIVAIR